MKQPGHNNKRSNGRDRSPSFQFYPGDWLTDPKLNLCLPQTKGLWMDLICHMYLSDEPGFLIFGDIILDSAGIQKLSKMNPKMFKKSFHELTKFGIIQRDELGRYFSKRMVNDERARQQWREIGKLGGNPNLKKGVNPTLKKKDNGQDNQFPTTSTSTSTSVINTQSNDCVFSHPLNLEIQKNFPSIAKMKSPLTDDQAEKLLNEYPMDEIIGILEAMENVPTLARKYKSTFLTIKNWIKHRKSNDNTNKNQSIANRNQKPNFDHAISNF